MSALRSLRVLILEDQPTDADLVLDELRQFGLEPEWSRVETQVDYLANLHEDLDLILADYSLPQFNALQALHGLQQSGLDIPFIVVTGTISEEVAVECMKQGAADYLLKDRLTRLGPAVVKALEDKRRRVEKQQAEAALRESQELLQRTFSSLHDAVFIVDANTAEIVNSNRAASKIFGYSREEMLGRATDFLHVDDAALQRFRESLNRAVAEKGFLFLDQFKMRRKDGMVFPTEHSVVPGKNEQGQQIFWVSVVRDITERKRAEEALRESEQALARAQNIGRLGNWTWDIAENSLTWSGELYRLFGVEKEHFALTYENIENKIHPDDRATNSAMVAQLLNSVGRITWEFRIIQSDGTVRWIHQIVEIARNSSGQPIRAFGTMQDITERKWAEEALRESERFARSTLDGLSAHIAILDEAGIILAVNHSWRAFAEENPPVAANVSEGANYLAVCDQASGPSSEGAAEFAAAIRAILGGKLDQFEAEYPCHSPTEQRWFVGRVTRFPGEGPVRVVVAHENTTQKKLAELKLAEERNLLRTLIDNLPDLIYAKDTEGRFLLENEAEARQMGAASIDEVIGKTGFDFYPSEIAEQYHADDQTVVRSGQPLINREEPFVSADGSQGWILTSKVPLRDDQGNVIGLVGIGHDITKRKQADETLRESEARLRTVLENMPVMLDALDENLNIIVWNHECERVTGYSADEIIHHSHVSELLYPDPLYRERMQGELTLTDDYRGWEWEMTCKDGSVRTIAWFNISRQYPVPGWASWGIGIDITERKRAEEALRATEERYRLISELMSDYAYSYAVEPDNTIAHEWVTEDSFKRVTGFTQEEIDRRGSLALYHPEDAPAVQRDLERVVAGQACSGEYRIITKSGELRWVTIYRRPIWDAQQNRVVRVYGSAQDITERKQAEEDLRKLSHAVEHSPVIIYITDSEGRIEYVNPKFAEITGYTAAEAIGRMPHILDPAKLTGEEYEERWNTIRSGHEWRGEFHNRKKNGEGYWESVAISSIKNAGGAVVHFVLVMEEITERKRMADAERDQRILAEALRDTAAALASSLDPGIVMVRILENVGRVMPHDYASIMIIEGEVARPVYCRGWQPDEETAFRALRFPLETRNLREMIITGKPAVIPDTAEYPGWVPVTPQVLSYIGAPIRSRDHVIGFLVLLSAEPGFFTAVHADRLRAFADQAATAIENAQHYDELKHYSSELEQRVVERTAQLNHVKERIETILNSSSDVIILCGTDSLIDQVNPAFDTEFQCTPDEIFNQPLAALAIPEHVSLLEQTFETVVQTRQPQRLEITVRYQASTPYDGEMMLSPVVGPDQHLLGVICSLRDITERKKMEVQLRQMLEHEMELSELKSRYVSMAAHDLRNPLAAIQTTVDVVQKYHDRLTEEQKQTKYDNIRRSIKVMVELLNDTLTIGQSELGKLTFEPGPLDLIPLCQNLVADLQPATGSVPRIKFSHQGVCSTVYLDVKLLRHILGNLLSNALKYSPSDSTVTFEIQCESSSVTFRIQDQGIGIPQTDQARLFEAFHRAENVGSTPGTGLGLAIVQQSVDLHGGTITFKSEEGVGTTFTVILPQPPAEK